MRRSRIAIAIVATATLVAACGGGDDEAEPEESLGPPDLVVVGEDIEFTRKAYEAEAGRNVVRLDNQGSLPHTLVIEDVDGFKLETGGGEEDVGAVTLEAGEYVLYCDVPGHRGSGMEADLTVS